MSANKKQPVPGQEQSTLFSAPREVDEKAHGKMRFKTLLVTAGVTLVLGGILAAAYFGGWLAKTPAVDVSEPSTTETTVPELKPLVDHSAESAASIKNVAVTFEKESYTLTPNGDGLLTLSDYPDLPRDDGVINDLLSLYNVITPSMEISTNPTADDVAACGLNSPALTVTVTYGDDSVHTLSLGRAASGDTVGYYGRFDKEPAIWLFDEAYHDAAAVDPLDFVGKTLITAPSPNSDDTVGTAKLKAMVLSGSLRKEEIKLRYIQPDDDSSLQMCSKFVLEEPFFRAVDNTVVESWDTSLTGLYAATIEAVYPTAAQLDSYGLSAPRSTATMTFGIYKATDAEGNTLETPMWYNEVSYGISLGNRTEDGSAYYAMMDGIDVVYTVNTAVVPWAETNYAALVNKALFLRNIVDVSGVRATVGDTAYDLALKHGTKKDENGSETATLTATINKNTIEESNARSLYEKIMSVQRVAAAPDDAVAAEKAALTIELLPLSGDADATFSFTPYSATRYLCTCSDGDRFLVKSTDVEELMAQWSSAANAKTTQSTAKKTNP